MSKKYKKNKDFYWGDEDSTELADEFYAYETGVTNVLVTPDEESIVDNSFNELESLIIRDIIGNEDTSDMDNTVTEYSNNTESEEIVELDSNIDAEPLRTEMLRTITVNISEEIGRIVIDDGISPTSYVYSTDLEPELNDVELNRDMITKLIEYIVSLKHPTAIYTRAEFEERFSKMKYCSSVDKLMLSDDNYVYIYFIDAESIGKLRDFIEDNSDDLSEMIKTFVAIAYACGRLDQVFIADDEEYVSVLYNSNYNQKDEVEYAIKHEMAYQEGDAESDTDYIIGINKGQILIELQSDARNLITDLIKDNDYMDFDDFIDDSDEEDIDENIENTEEAVDEETEIEDKEETSIKEEEEEVPVFKETENEEIDTEEIKRSEDEDIEIKMDVPNYSFESSSDDIDDIDNIDLSSDETLNTDSEKEDEENDTNKLVVNVVRKGSR